MAIRWVINPVVETTSNGTTYRAPKVAGIVDAGRAGGKTVEHTSIIVDGVGWCLSKVHGVSLSNVLSDVDCVDLFEEDYANGGSRTVSDLGWNQAKLTRVRSRLEAKGVDTSGYTGATPLWRIVLDLAKVLAPGLTRSQLAEYRVKGG